MEVIQATHQAPEVTRSHNRSSKQLMNEHHPSENRRRKELLSGRARTQHPASQEVAPERPKKS